MERIDIDKMKAINIAFPKRKLNEIAKSLYLEHGWKMPEGFRDKTLKNPLNYTRAEWQQAARIGRKPSEIKHDLQESWAISDSKMSFDIALQDKGYYLARGDRRGYVADDLHGEVYSLTRQLGQGEELKRSERIRKGFKGIWDKLNGRCWKTRKRNERETWQVHIRDQKQREELIQKQLAERQGLQNQLKLLQENQEKERSTLIRGLSHATKSEQIKNHKQEKIIIKDT